MLHKRQDLALSKNESSNVDLAKKLQSHAAENRGLHSQNRELAHKLKQKELVLMQIDDKYFYIYSYTFAFSKPINTFS